MRKLLNLLAITSLAGCVGAILAESSSLRTTARELFLTPRGAHSLLERERAQENDPSDHSVKQTAPEHQTQPDSKRIEVLNAPDTKAEALVAHDPPPQPVHEAPLAMRYIVEKEVDGRVKAVSKDSVFYSGDRIRLNVEANQDAYLYLLNRGSSGGWRVLFPNPEINDGSNKVRGGESYRVPSPGVGWFQFDGRPGEERLVILLSVSPINDLESRIYRNELEEYAPDTDDDTQHRFLAAGALDDFVVQGQRERIRARDLVFDPETVDSLNGATTMASYVAARDGLEVTDDVVFRHR